MKKMSKRILALMMAAIMAIPAILVMPFSTSAASKVKLAWDFTNGVNIQNDGSEYHPSAYGNAKLRMIHYGSNTYSYQYGGLRTADGFVYIENLADYLEADKDISIKFALDIGANIDANHGAFAIGSALGNDSGGEQSFNDVVYMKNDGTLNYRAGGSTENILTGSKVSLATSTNYTFEIYYDNANKKLTVYKDNEIIGEKTDSANLSTSDFNFLGIGVWQYTYYGNFCLKSIEISQPDTTDYAAVAKANYNSISKQNVTASEGIHFSGDSAGAVKANVLYPNGGGFVDSSYSNYDLSGNSNTRMQSKVMAPASRMVFLYNGNSTDIKIPVIAENYKNGGTCKGYIVNYYAGEGNWTVNTNWYKCDDYNKWNQNVSGSVNDTTIVSYDTSHDPDYLTSSSGGTGDTIRLSNYVYYTGAISGYSASLGTPTFTVSFDGRGSWIGGSGTWLNKAITGITLGNNGTVEVKALNYVPFAAVVDEINGTDFQTLFNTVKNNEWMYTDASLANFYKAVAEVASFNLNDYDFGTDGGLNKAAADMQKAVEDFNAINLVKKTFTATFKNAAGTTIEARQITAGNALGELPANTAGATHIANTNTHSVYTWEGVTTAETVITDSVEFTETTKTENCTFTAGAHTDATDALNGYTTYACACTNSYKSYDALNFDAYTAAVEEAEALKVNEAYTAESRTTYSAAVEAAKLTAAQIADETLAPKVIADAVQTITDAKSLLEAVPVDEPEDTYNLTITDDIDINFNIDTEYHDAEDGYITVEYVEINESEISTTTTTDRIDATGAQTSISMTAIPAQIAEPYVITVYNKDGDVIREFEQSVVDYCNAVINSTNPAITEADKEVAKGLLDYGAAANTYFEYANISETDNYTVNHSDDYNAYATGLDVNDIKAKAKASGKAIGFTSGVDESGKPVGITGISYLALIEPEFRFYVSQENEVWAALTEVSIDDPELEAKMVKTANGNCVRVTGLKASDFGKTFTITIGTATLTYNGYAFLYTALTNNNVDENMKNFATGIYRYAAACEAKFAD